MATVYERLAAEFDQHFTDTRGGVELTYVTGEQVISRLNDVLGVAGWNFTVREHGINEQADEVWVLGDLTVTLDGTTVLKSQFGSQKLKRKRQAREDGTREILDIGFDLKGAATDALKKCATLIGVGLYLSRKEEQRPAQPSRPPGRAAAPEPTPVKCQDCSGALRGFRRKDGSIGTPADLATETMTRFNRILCSACAGKAAAPQSEVAF